MLISLEIKIQIQYSQYNILRYWAIVNDGIVYICLIGIRLSSEKASYQMHVDSKHSKRLQNLVNIGNVFSSWV